MKPVGVAFSYDLIQGSRLPARHRSRSGEAGGESRSHRMLRGHCPLGDRRVMLRKVISYE